MAQKKRLGLTPFHTRIALYFRTLRDQTAFQAFIIGVIFLAGVLVGVNTYDVQSESVKLAIRCAVPPPAPRPLGPPSHPGAMRRASLLDEVVVGIFVAEVAVKLLAEGKAPWRYFHDR